MDFVYQTPRKLCIPETKLWRIYTHTKKLVVAYVITDLTIINRR